MIILPGFSGMSGMMGRRRDPLGDSNGLAAWFKPQELGLSNGAAVSSMPSAFGGFNAAAASGEEPTCISNALNGFGALNFDGSKAMTWSGGPSGTTHALFMVVNIASTGLNVLSGVDGSAYYGSSGGGLVYSPSSATWDGPARNEWFLISLLRNATDVRIYINNNQLESPKASSGGAFTFGNLGGFSSYKINAQIGECAFYTADKLASLTAIREAIYRRWRNGKTLIAFQGNSLFAGYGLSTGQDIVSQTAGLLGAGYDYKNRGITGESITGMIQKAPNTIDAEVGTWHTSVVIVSMEFTNAFWNEGKTASQAMAQWEAYSLARMATGARHITCTVLPTPHIPEGDRTTINNWIRDPAHIGVLWHGVADFAADSRIGAAGVNNNSTYFLDDTHWNATGAGIGAQIVADKISELRA